MLEDWLQNAKEYAMKLFIRWIFLIFCLFCLRSQTLLQLIALDSTTLSKCIWWTIDRNIDCLSIVSNQTPSKLTLQFFKIWPFGFWNNNVHLVDSKSDLNVWCENSESEFHLNSAVWCQSVPSQSRFLFTAVLRCWLVAGYMSGWEDGSSHQCLCPDCPGSRSCWRSAGSWDWAWLLLCSALQSRQSGLACWLSSICSGGRGERGGGTSNTFIAL